MVETVGEDVGRPQQTSMLTTCTRTPKTSTDDTHNTHGTQTRHGCAHRSALSTNKEPPSAPPSRACRDMRGDNYIISQQKRKEEEKRGIFPTSGPRGGFRVVCQNLLACVSLIKPTLFLAHNYFLVKTYNYLWSTLTTSLYLWSTLTFCRTLEMHKC